jgi:hypothetical protein
MSSRKIILFFSFLTIHLACNNSAQVEVETDNQTEAVVEEEVIQFEESMPDSGLLDNVNPEEIITDDWSDEGDIELDTEK